jgi:hypothetical protein
MTTSDMPEISDILDAEHKTVDSVTSAMRELRVFLGENKYDSMLPFLDAYINITDGVTEWKDEDKFNSPDELSELDTRFAQLYFDSVRQYIQYGEKQKPWRTYFDYIERNDSKPVLEILLGINAHINSDLTQALSEQQYTNISDFNRVNNILGRSLYPVLYNTAVQRMDIEMLGYALFFPCSLIGLGKIKGWRRSSYVRSTRCGLDLVSIKEEAEQNAETLIDLRHNVGKSVLTGKVFKYFLF